MGFVSMAIKLADLPTRARLDDLEAKQLDLASKLEDTQHSVHNCYTSTTFDKTIDRNHQADEVLGDTQQHATKVGHTQHQTAMVGVTQHQAAKLRVMPQHPPT